jgi:uncharacterized membrane protein YdbT with pleckstrin-like domain
MMELRQEITLAKVRLHWGIFIPVLLFAFGPLVALLPLIFILHGFLHSLTQMEMRVNQSPSIGSLNVIWLLPLVPYLVIVIGLLLGTWFSYSKSEVTLTNRRLVFRTGFLSRRSGELPLENVESIYISEALFGRLFGYGTIMVTTVGGAHFSLSFIGSPQTFHSTLQKAVLDVKSVKR